MPLQRSSCWQKPSLVTASDRHSAETCGRGSGAAAGPKSTGQAVWLFPTPGTAGPRVYMPTCERAQERGLALPRARGTHDRLSVNPASLGRVIVAHMPTDRTPVDSLDFLLWLFFFLQL